MLTGLSTFGNVVLMLLGFGGIIAIHELGHFLAARWAGIRVHAFAIGFGHALASWRKGMGWRRGSSEAEYLKLVRAEPERAAGVSATEYRLNWFPFGGYVRMLGQEDLDPRAVSSAPDSFQSKPVWKRMVVISGGVVMNLLLAAVLFVIAFMIGFREQPAMVGGVMAGSPAEQAGLESGDLVVAVNGEPITAFKRLGLAAAMTGRGDPVRLTVQRLGEEEKRTVEMTPVRGPMALLHLGVFPVQGASLIRDFAGADERAQFEAVLESAGLTGLPPGSEVVEVNGEAVAAHTAPGGVSFSSIVPLERALRASAGAPVRAVFRTPQGGLEERTLHATPALETGTVRAGEARGAVRHLLGLTPVMQIDWPMERARRFGFERGDVIARIGALEWPSTAEGIAEIRRQAGREVEIEVERNGERRTIRASVSRQGQVGFLVTTTAWSSTRLAAAPELVAADEESTAPARPAAARLTPPVLPGSSIVSVNGAAVSDFIGVLTTMVAATRSAHEAGNGAEVSLTLALPGGSVTEERSLELTPEEVRTLHTMEWTAERLLPAFDFAEFVDRAANPIAAIGRGVGETHYVMTMTYLTLLRLFQGTVPASQLQGPVGITHLGSRIADRGLIYLIFFLGLISANLAVINFLPIPVVDGGHMVFLAVEGITGKPVSVAVQNLATMAGLVLIGAVFLFVTFHDLVRLFG